MIDNYIYKLKSSLGFNNPNKSNCALFTYSEVKPMLENLDSFKFPEGQIFTKYNRIGLVINHNNKHWFFIGVFPNESKIIIYDSVPKPST